MTTEHDKIQKRLEQKLHAFSGRFMSNAKWLKVFSVLSENSHIIRKCLVKDVSDDQLRELKIPPVGTFSHTFSDTGINDVMTGGPSSFKEIEWIEFPASLTILHNMREEKLEPIQYRQDLSAIRNILEKAGKLELELTDEQLIVYGYKE